MNILITGGAGFIGSHLAEYYIDRGDAVFVVDNLSAGRYQNIQHLVSSTRFTFEKADLLTWPRLAEMTAWADLIYHLAAKVGMYYLITHPVDTITTNIFITERLLRTIAATKPTARFILASTSEVYGENKKRLKETDPLPFFAAADSKWVYATSKFADEVFTLAYVREKKIPATIIRFFNTIGPRQNSQYGMVVPRFIDQAIAAQPITVFGDGEQTRSFCDVRDTVQLLAQLACHPETVGEIINLGQDNPISINQLALTIKTLAQSSSKIIHLSYEKAYGQAYEDILFRRPNLEKLKKYVEFKPQWSLQRTLKDLVDRKLAAS